MSHMWTSHVTRIDESPKYHKLVTMSHPNTANYRELDRDSAYHERLTNSMRHRNTTNLWPWVNQIPRNTRTTANSTSTLDITKDSRTRRVTQIPRTTAKSISGLDITNRTRRLNIMDATNHHKTRNESSKNPQRILTMRTERVVEMSQNQRVGHAAFIREMWLIHVWAMTHSCVSHDSFMCEPWLIHVCETCRIHPWDVTVTHSCVSHDSFMYVRHASFMCETWLITCTDPSPTSRMSHVVSHSYVWHSGWHVERGVAD